jgi:hypothetical protein
MSSHIAIRFGQNLKRWVPGQFRGGSCSRKTSPFAVGVSGIRPRERGHVDAISRGFLDISIQSLESVGDHA